MGQLTGLARASALAWITVFCCFAEAHDAFAAAQKQTAAVPASAPAKPPADAEEKQNISAQSRRNYEAGVKAYQAGKLQPAVEDLSAALRGGGLQSPEMARALFVRGMAYKKQSKPGLAISDLTSALWLKNGLSDADRQSATAERAEAYRLAGLGDGNSGAETVAVADPNASAAPAPPIPAGDVDTAATAKPTKKTKPAAVAARTPAAEVPPTPTAEITRQSPDSEAAKDAARAREIARQQTDENSLHSAVSGRAVSAANASGAVAPVEAPAAQAVVANTAPAPAVTPPVPAISAPQISSPVSSPVSGSPTADAVSGVAQGPAAVAPKNTVVGFFSNLFGGSGSSSPPAETAPQTATAADVPAVAASSPPVSTPGAGTNNAPLPKPPVTTAAISPVRAVTPVKTGKYKLHIAALRSRSEAEAMAQLISRQHGEALNNHPPQVDEAVIGSMGTFYRVRVSGYAEPNEPRTVCNKLRTSGLDCLVVTN